MSSNSPQLSILMKPPYPMLARAGRVSDVEGALERGYCIEPKIDGIRCLAVVGVIAGERVVRLFNRQLVDITLRFPDVVNSLRSRVHHASNYTLDGEIYVRGEDGQPDFQLVQHRANRLRDVQVAMVEYPARYAAFDVLRINDRDVTGWTLDSRRSALDDVAGSLKIAEYTQDEADHLTITQEGEGLMLKLWSSRYRVGERDASWLKVKWLHEVEAVVGGITFGIGKRASTFGGLLVGVYKPGDAHGTGRLQYLGTVGTGFTDAALGMLATHFRSIKTADCPFAERGSDWDLAYFVRPVMKVRVAFAQYTRDGIMRFPRYISLA